MTDRASAPGIDDFIIAPTASIAEAMARIDRAGSGALALCTGERELRGVLTDGDIRRAIVHGISLEDPCETIAAHNPMTAQDPISGDDALRLMNRHDISHLPVVDTQGRLQDFLLRKNLLIEEELRETGRRRLDAVVIAPDISIIDAISRLDRAGTGALALCTGERKLVGLLTDGDIRRAILRGTALEDPCETIAVRSPFTVQGSISDVDALHLMIEHDINHLPVLDSRGSLNALLLRRDLARENELGMSAVIMAGGFGKRLLPLTKQLPKPMLPVGGRPLLERTIEQLRRSGIRDVHLATHYLPEHIVQHFGDGDAFGVRLTYLQEDQPLGTAGGLKLMEKPDGPFVVINGDVLTGISFQEMLAYHQEHRAEITVGVRKYEVKVPFGVVDCDDVRITRIREKPLFTLLVNAGVYLMEPSACDYIPDGQAFDMTELIQCLLDAGRPVVSFPIIEYWLDIGRPRDYRQAQEDVRNSRV